MASTAYALQCIKTNPLEVLDRQAVERVYRQCRHQWRHRELDPATTVALFCQQVTRGNLSCRELLRATGTVITEQAYCAARVRLPLKVVQGLLGEVFEAALPQTRRQEVPVSRISFADALYWVRYARPGDRLPELKVNPLRPNRVEPRSKKRRAKQYDRMNKPREELRKALKNGGKRGESG